jgi:hypothetical protein
MDTVEESVTVALFREWLTQKSYSWSKLIDDVGEKKFDETIITSIRHIMAKGLSLHESIVTLKARVDNEFMCF